MTEASDPGLYQRFIAMNYAAHSALEPLLDGHVELDATIGSNSRTILLSALASDMRQMGLHPAATIPFPFAPSGSRRQRASPMYLMGRGSEPGSSIAISWHAASLGDGREFRPPIWKRRHSPTVSGIG